MRTEFSELIGKTLSSIHVQDDSILFTTVDGEKYKMFHEQDCCESVVIDDINGDWNDVIGSPILQFEEVSNNDFEDEWESKYKPSGKYGDRKTEDGDYYPESHTWTFYKLRTIKGSVDILWFGESNGYYSDSVDFYKRSQNGLFNYFDE